MRHSVKYPGGNCYGRHEHKHYTLQLVPQKDWHGIIKGVKVQWQDHRLLYPASGELEIPLETARWLAFALLGTAENEFEGKGIKVEFDESSQ
jgi:hypothetical protein